MDTVNNIKKVKLRKGIPEELSKVFRVSKTTISMSVCGHNNSALAQEIRKKAVELGGDAIFGEFEQRKPAMSSILAKEFGITTQAVRNALRSLSNSELAHKVRKAAVELGVDVIIGEFRQEKPVMSIVLAKRFGVTTQTVRNALRGISNSELAQRIREAAVELGGDAIYGKKKQIKIFGIGV
jgi:DeoR/GlpR family transcriptional regulator of sugar metabolism